MGENLTNNQAAKGDKKGQEKMSFKEYLDLKQKQEAKKPFQLPMVMKILLAIPLIPILLFALIFIPMTIYQLVMGMIVPQ